MASEIRCRNIISPRARRARGLVSKIAIRAAVLSWRRKDFGGAGGEGVGGGPGGKVRGPGWTGDQTCRSLSVCLSVTGRTSPSCLGQSSRNFRWWSESWSGTFISGTGPIGQGTGEKKEGNLNFGRVTL